MAAKKLTDGTTYRSDEEVYFSWFLDELVELGFIDRYGYESREIILFDGLYEKYEEVLKTKVKQKQFKISSKRVYTPDFEIFWNPKAEGIFYNELGCGLHPDYRAYFTAQNGVSLVEVKPTFDANNMTRLVKGYIDWVYDRHELFVQLVIPAPKVSKTGKVSPTGTLFEDCAIPKKYLGTDGSSDVKYQLRKIRFKYTLISDYIKERRDGKKQ